MRMGALCSSRLAWGTNRLLCTVLGSVSLVVASPDVHLAFRDSACVNDTAVLLGDIADIECETAGLREELSTLDLGRAAPPGFSRFMNPREAARYAMSKNYPSIQPDMTGPARIKISTDSRQIKLIDFKDDIIDYLNRSVQWKPGQFSVVLIDSGLVWSGYDKPFQAAVEGLESAYPKGTTQLRLRLIQEKASRSVAFNCRIHVTVPVFVARKTIQRGETVTPDCVELAARDITRFRHEPYESAGQLRGTVAARTIPQGTILHSGFLKLKPAVYKGDVVYVVFEKGSVKVSVPVRAREDGAVGERIWVENTETHRIFQVEITGAARAVISSQEAI